MNVRVTGVIISCLGAKRKTIKYNDNFCQDMSMPLEEIHPHMNPHYVVMLPCANNHDNLDELRVTFMNPLSGSYIYVSAHLIHFYAVEYCKRTFKNDHN